MVIHLRLNSNIDLKTFILVLLSVSQIATEIFLSLIFQGKSFSKAASFLNVKLDLAKTMVFHTLKIHAGVLEPVQPI